MGERSRAALKRDKSRRTQEAKQSRFTVIVDAQGGLCWFCNDRMGMDCTKEHLHPQCFGGTDTKPAGNLKAAHADCNSAAGHLPLTDKHRLREVGHAEGRAAMLAMAKSLRRADARIGYGAKDQHPELREQAVAAKSGVNWKKLGLPGKPSWWDG